MRTLNANDGGELGIKIKVNHVKYSQYFKYFFISIWYTINNKLELFYFCINGFIDKSIIVSDYILFPYQSARVVFIIRSQ